MIFFVTIKNDDDEENIKINILGMNRSDDGLMRLLLSEAKMIRDSFYFCFTELLYIPLLYKSYFINPLLLYNYIIVILLTLHNKNTCFLQF